MLNSFSILNGFLVLKIHLIFVVWISQGVFKNVALSNMVKQRLCDQYKQTWYERVFNTAKCLNYRIFKC